MGVVWVDLEFFLGNGIGALEWEGIRSLGDRGQALALIIRRKTLLCIPSIKVRGLVQDTHKSGNRGRQAFNIIVYPLDIAPSAS